MERGAVEIPLYRKPPITVEAVYKGYESSLGYKKGMTYTLVIHENCILRPMAVVYTSVEMFLRNWTLAHSEET